MPSTLADMPLGTPPRTFQELIFALQKYWADQGCVILQPYDMEMGAGTFHTATFLQIHRSRALVGSVRAAFTPSHRRPVRRQSVSPAALLPIPGSHQTFAAADSRSVSRITARAGLRHARTRRAIRGGQLGIAHSRRLGPGVGSLVERNGSHAIHLLPAGRWPRLQTRDRRNHLRSRAPRDVPAGCREHFRHRVD